MPMAKPPHNT
jgi:hypothetical protein